MLRIIKVFAAVEMLTFYAQYPFSSQNSHEDLQCSTAATILINRGNDMGHIRFP